MDIGFNLAIVLWTAILCGTLLLGVWLATRK